MPRTRHFALGGLIVVTAGSLTITAGYVWYLRSAGYRQRCAAYLSEALGLPSDIGRIVPRSWASREFDDVVVWLPQRRGKALSCEQALVIYTPRPDDPEAYEIELRGGTCEISTRSWLREDYRRVIESGLRPGFDPAGPQQVRFSHMDLRFDRDRFRGSLDDASGLVVFERPDLGSATILCSALNGYAAPEPALLQVRFSPRVGGIRIDELLLKVPHLPVAVLGLGELAGLELRRGTFTGQLAYAERDGVRRLSLSGKCQDLSLAEVTAGLTSCPWRGTCPEVELEELTLENGRPRNLRFRGVLTGVVLGDVLSPWGLDGVGGELILRVREAHLSPAGLERLVASGECVGLSLEALTRGLGLGGMSGTARLLIDDLTVEHNRLRSLDAEFRIERTDEPRWVEGRLLTELIGRVLNMQVPPILPERIEYTQLGLRLDVRDEVLHVFGTHGPRGKTIVTVRLFGQEVPLFEPQHPFDLSAWFDQLRSEATLHLRQRLDRLAAEHAGAPPEGLRGAGKR